MKIYKEPVINPIAFSVVNEDGLSEFITSLGLTWRSDAEYHCDAISEIAGRLCYLSYESPRPGGNAAYLNNIIKQGHGSVLEHASAAFILEGVSRTLTHELIRHRAGFAYSELSQRFVELKAIGFVVPPDYLNGCPHVYDIWYESVGASFIKYKALVDHSLSLACMASRKRRLQAARSVLPGCTETKIFVTGNLRAWRHFIELRSDAGADEEIRRLASMLFKVLKTLAPNAFADMSESEMGIKSFLRPKV